MLLKKVMNESVHSDKEEDLRVFFDESIKVLKNALQDKRSSPSPSKKAPRKTLSKESLYMSVELS